MAQNNSTTKIKIAGASGYLGKVIANKLQEEGYDVSGIRRDLLYGPAENLAGELKKSDVLINLAGAPVLQRWNTKNKKIIYESRVQTTKNLARACQLLFPEERPSKVIAASAIGIYAPGKRHTEASVNFDNGFLGEVVKSWENAWNRLPGEMQLTVFRIAVVLGKRSATIKKLLLPFKLGIGGKTGSGKQPFPFVHETDVAHAFLWATSKNNIGGVFNLVAPQQITNLDFTQALGKKLKRPTAFSTPEFALKLLFGKAAEILTQSPAVLPQKLTEAGFEFNYSTINKALSEIFG
ncbi:hypothetical protein SAMN05444274_102359 [Mariniphaga anaerophila]|uniref:TIGR01777 family protein n=1 Tax=Mariniphaga anaerophila TaxID=1484053 RepID=A0A1M4W8I4_9BACT|nr:TIGR01777 family oxidoreductase [Mariniphaga anaerophila]SHE77465.1 hypothetical protein SAMN05444274_102359 [Mariniphaga anaerophila]